MVYRWAGRFSSVIAFFILVAPFGLITTKPALAFEVRSAISAGYIHSLGLKSDGTVWAWGANSSGQLGDGSNSDNNLPVKTLIINNVVSVSGGENYSVALKSDGTVWAWGNNNNGQLGDGTNVDSNSPVRVVNLDNIVAISAGMAHVLALKSDGTVWAWGKNPYGELGNGNFSPNSNFPVQVVSGTSGSHLAGIKAIAAGGYHSLALRSDGTVWAWGGNEFGQLGNGSNDIASNVPVKVQDFLDKDLTRIVAISAGELHSIALKSNGWDSNGNAADGYLWAWGSNQFGQLGKGNEVIESKKAVSVPSTYRIIAISAGYGHSLALQTDGTVLSWGYNGYGQLGNGNTSDNSIANEIMNFDNVVAISAGYLHSLAMRVDGKVWGWGANSVGQLGNGGWDDSHIPVQSDFSLKGTPPGVISIQAGDYHSLGLTSDGGVWAWGSNDRGQLGNGQPIVPGFKKEVPAPVLQQTDGPQFTGVKTVTAGEEHSLALKPDGTVWAWGANYNGQLGIGNLIGQNVPVQVLRLNIYGSGDVKMEDIVAIEAGWQHSLALLQHGMVYAWGSNEYGQLGGFGGSKYLTPKSDKGILVYEKYSGDYREQILLMDIVAISAGGYHSLALKSDGTVWAWGRNDFGQLGNGNSYSDNNTPARVLNLDNIVSISAGYFHSLALRSDGTVWAWGENNDCQLGNRLICYPSPVQYISVPIRVSEDPNTYFSNTRSISAGLRHSLALKSNGTPWGWGNNIDGYLGVGYATTPVTPPLRVLLIENVQNVSSGSYHSLALKSDGTVWAWGGNNYDEVGDGVNTSSVRRYPVQTAFLPDLLVESISLDNPAPAPTVPVGVTVRVKNGGYWDANGEISIKFFKQQPLNVPIQDDFHCMREGLPSGVSTECSGSVVFPVDNNYTMFALVDQDNKVKEYDENNNSLSQNVTVRSDGVDLAVLSVSFSPGMAEPGDTINITDVTRNMGVRGNSSDTRNRYFLAGKQFDSLTYISLLGGRDVPPLSSRTENVGTANVTVPANVFGRFYVIACADNGITLGGPGSVIESNEFNNCTSSTTQIVIGRPDLIVASVGNIPEIAAIGKPITLSDTTRNVGTVPTKSLTYTSYELIPFGRGEHIDNTSRPVGAGLGPNIDNTGSIRYVIYGAAPVGYYRFRVCANNGTNPLVEIPNGQENCNYSNKSLFTLPDLQIRSISEPPKYYVPGERTRLSDNTWNAGLVASDPSFTKYYLSVDPISGPHTYITERYIGSLDANASNFGEFWFNVPNSMAFGKYYLRVCADDNKGIREVDENNNCRWSSQQVEVGKPDLIVGSVKKDSALGAPIGGRITVTDNTQNIGTIPTLSPTFTSYYLSLNQGLDRSDIYLGQRFIEAGLLPSAGNAGTMGVTIPNSTARGRYYILACADSGRNNRIAGELRSGIVEISETNNCKASDQPFEVDLPNLTMTDVSGSLPSEALHPGDVIAIYFRVRNVGSVPTQTDSDVKVYLSQDNNFSRIGDSVGSTTIPIVGPGLYYPGTGTQQLGIIIPALPNGTYTFNIFACVDETKTVREGNESDNCKYFSGSTRTTITVQAP